MKKKFYLMLVCGLFALSTSFAQTYKYQTTDFAYKYKNDYGVWTNWSEWEPSNMLVVLSLDRNILSIYSKELQEYDIYDWGNGFESESDGGSSWKLRGVNRDGLRCGIRLRVQSDGQMQMYIDFNDFMWVYCVYRKN